MLNALMNNLLWSEGAFALCILVIIGGLGVLFSRSLMYFSLALFVFGLFFFRNPERQIPQNPRAIVAPADGKIMEISDIDEGPYRKKVSIFLSLFDVHVNRAPIAGEVTDISYYPGVFNMAFLPKSDDRNERNEITIKQRDLQVKMVQIAGFIARRIACWVKEGQELEKGQKVGMIRFGSRVDLYLPEGAHIAVSKGLQVYGGSTIIANISD